MEISTQSSVAWMNCPVEDVRKDAVELASSFGFRPAMVERLLASRFASVQDGDTELGILVPAILVEAATVVPHPVLILIRDGVILSIHDRHVTRFASFIRYAEGFIKKMPAEFKRADQLTSILLRLLDENNRRNFNCIRNLNQEIDKASKSITMGRLHVDTLLKTTRKTKERMIVYLGALWENYNVMKALEDADMELLSSRPEMLDHFSHMVTEHGKYLRLAENLSAISTSGSQVIHENYMIQLLRMNNILQFTSAWLGVLGTIFLVPNTIATAAASPAFPLGPEDWWWYTLMLVGSTVISTLLVYKAIRRIWDVTMRNIILKVKLTTAQRDFNKEFQRETVRFS